MGSDWHLGRLVGLLSGQVGCPVLLQPVVSGAYLGYLDLLSLLPRGASCQAKHCLPRWLHQKPTPAPGGGRGTGHMHNPVLSPASSWMTQVDSYGPMMRPGDKPEELSGRSTLASLLGGAGALPVSACGVLGHAGTWWLEVWPWYL